MQEKVNAYLLETITQINKLTNIFMSVDLSADDLHRLVGLKNQVIEDLNKLINEFDSVADMGDAK